MLTLASSLRFRPSSYQSYQPLPTTSYNELGVPTFRSKRASGRQKTVVGLLITSILLIFVRITVRQWSGVPDYADIKQYEKELPQHDLDLPFPEGRNGSASFLFTSVLEGSILRGHG